MYALHRNPKIPNIPPREFPFFFFFFHKIRLSRVFSRVNCFSRYTCGAMLGYGNVRGSPRVVVPAAR